MPTGYRLFIADQFPEPAFSPSGALVMGIGNSTQRAVSTVASSKFLSFYFEQLAAGGYGLYVRQYLSTAGIDGDAARFYGTVNNVAASTARGAHISLNFADSGTVTGLGVALECTLHIPNDATQSGTLAALKVAINSDGSTSDPAGSALSYIYVANQGDATGGADVDDDAALFDITGHTIATGNMVAASATEANYSHSVRVRINGTSYYMMLASAEG